MRLLLIEDFDPLRKSLVRGLTEAGFAVDATGSGREGSWYANDGSYDVIVLDLNLPEVDGLTILRDMRKAGGKAHVLILTARDAVEDRVEGLNLGADDYLIKPFSFDELLARLRALIRRSYEQKDPIIRVGDLSIDTTAQVVFRGEVRIELSAREYSLLEFLAMRLGEVVSRSEIWEHLYDFRNEATSNVVDVYVSYLRRKLDGVGLPPLLHTHRGSGYRLGLDS